LPVSFGMDGAFWARLYTVPPAGLSADPRGDSHRPVGAIRVSRMVRKALGVSPCWRWLGSYSFGPWRRASLIGRATIPRDSVSDIERYLALSGLVVAPAACPQDQGDSEDQQTSTKCVHRSDPPEGQEKIGE